MIKLLERACEHLNQGGIVAYPTDTLWGLGVAANNAEAIDKLNRLKGRSNQSAMSVIVNDISMASELVELSSNDKKLLQLLWPGPTTFIFESLNKLPASLEGGTGCLGLRCFRQRLTNDLMWQFGGAMTTTSANLSNEIPSSDMKSLKAWLPKDIFILDESKVSSATSEVCNSSKDGGQASTIVTIQAGTFQVLRSGDQNQGHLKLVLESLDYSPA